MNTATIDDRDGTLAPPGESAAPPIAGLSFVLELALVFLLVSTLCWLGVVLGRHSDGVATIWLSNGLLFAIVIRRPRSAWLAYGVVGYTADVLGASIVGGAVPPALGASLANSTEVFLAASLLTRWFGSPLKLSQPKPLFAFFGAAVLLVPALTSAIAVLWNGLFFPLSWWHAWTTWYLGDALGMAIIAPLVYTFQEPSFLAMFHKSRLGQTLPVLAAPALAAAIDFTQSREPVVLFFFPALVFTVFRLRFAGAAMTIFLIACIAIPLTILGHGPMMLATNCNLLHKIVVVQIFLAVALFTAFPIASLLEERTALEVALQRREAQFRELANTDALTGQANRRAFDERLEAEWQRSATLKRPLALLSLDVDHFKAYNDIYGHIAGDDCLRRIASLAAEALHQGTSARLYRLGGEEFAIILPNANADEALGIAERIRQTVVAAHIDHTGSPNGRQTLSIGVAATIPTPASPALSLLALSDQALYNAKHNGRNRCQAAT